MSKFLEFVRSGDEFIVRNKLYNLTLGRIYFFSKWRKFVFEPERDTFYDVSCLGDVVDFMNTLR